MSLILNALRKLDQQDVNPAAGAAKADAQVPDPQAAPHESGATVEPIQETDALDNSSLSESNLNAPIPSEDTHTSDREFVLQNQDGNVPVETEPSHAAEEIEEDYNIPATDNGPADTLNAWAESSVTQENHQDDALPFYNPVVDAVDLDELDGPGNQADVVASRHSHSDAQQIDAQPADEQPLDAQPIEEPDAIVVSDDDHYFCDDEPEVSAEPVGVSSKDESPWPEVEADVSRTAVDDAEAEIAPTQPAAVDAVEAVDESSPHDAPWVTLPSTDQTQPSSADVASEDWQDEQPQTNTDVDAASSEWHDGLDSQESDQRTIEHIENEIDNCDALTHAVAHGSEAESDVVVAAEAIPNAEEGAAESQLNAVVDESPDSQSSTVAPSDYERQILERLTNQQYERRFNEVYEETVKLIGDSNPISIAVVAPHPSNVTSHAAAHLAIVVASTQRKHVQLIDGNEARWLTVQFGHEEATGLRAACVEAQSDQYLQLTSLPTMRILPAGIDNSSEFKELASKHVDEFRSGIANALRSCEVTVIDAGDVAGATADVLSAAADVTLLIAESGQITVSQLLAAEDRLKAAGAQNIACILSGEYATKV